MAFRDQILRCAATGKTFVWTVAEQRERARKGLPMDPPLYCPEVRAADVRLAGAGGDDEPEDDAPRAAAARGRAPSGARAGGDAQADDADLDEDEDEDGDAAFDDEEDDVRVDWRAAEATRAPAAAARGDAPRRGASRSARPSDGGPRGGRGRGQGRGRSRRDDGGDVPRQDELRVRHTGTVKWFDPDRGFGFVVHEEGGELFLHGSSLLGDAVALLREGTPVEYEIVNTTRGRRAVDVVALA